MPRRSITLSEWDAAGGLASNKSSFEHGDILFGKLRPYFHKVGVAPVDGVCSTDIVVLAPRSPEWFGFVLGHASSDEFVDYTDAVSTGTRMPRTKWKDMARYVLLTPSEPVAAAFNERVQASVTRMVSAIHQSRASSAQRDALLPRLVSGQVRVGPKTMSSRRSVPRDVERMLWSESGGYCMNPGCEARLFSEDGTNLSDRAHIVPDAEGGPPSFENLLLLCQSCHRLVDTNRTSGTVETLRSWKTQRQQDLTQRFERRYDSFESLRADVVPILTRNEQLFTHYGPNPSSGGGDERHRLWRKFEGEIVSNNRRLELMLSKNKHLFHSENWDIITRFIGHAKEFAQTRDEEPVRRELLFPIELLSIFGMESVHDRLFPNVSALQNLITKLVRDGAFVELELEPRQLLTYRASEGIIRLDLNNRPFMQQLFWNGRHYHPRTTELRMESLVFVVKWLQRRGISYTFADVRELTELTLNGKYHVKLYYSYLLSQAELFGVNVKDNMLAVNVHNWNDGPISGEAGRYASAAGFQVMNQAEFFAFADRNIR